MKMLTTVGPPGNESTTGGITRFNEINGMNTMSFQVSSNLSEQIAEHITDKIIRMEIRPGERIMETSIAEELSVSRSPIREALRILEKNRLVELIPRRGARVTELSETFISHLCDVLAALLSLTARELVQKGSEGDLEAIDQAARNAQECVANDDLYGYYTSVFTFAIACLKATHNPLLEQMVSELMPSVRRVLYASLSTKNEALQRNVETVLTGNRYAQERNGEMAKQIVCDYIQRVKEFALKNQMLVSQK